MWGSLGRVHTCTVSEVFGQLKARPALACHTPLGGLSADVGAAMILVHAVHSI